MVVTVRADIEIDVEELINELIKEEYGDTVDDITMSDIEDYMQNNLSFLDHRYQRGKWSLEGLQGSFNGFDGRSYNEIEEKLESMKGE